MTEDHTRSLIPYSTILESHEQEYRESDGDERSTITEEISQEIRQVAKQGGAKIARGEDLQKICGVLVL